MRRVLLVTALAAAGCTAARPDPATPQVPRGEVPMPVVVATFTGEVDPGSGSMTIRTEPTAAGRLAGMSRMTIADPAGVRIENDPAGALWTNATGHCNDPGARSSGRKVQATSVSSDYKTTTTYLSGVYAQITSMSNTGSASCNSSEKPSWILDDPGLGLWEFPFALTDANYTSTREWAFNWNSGSSFTFSGRVLAASYLAVFTPAEARRPTADITTAWSVRNVTAAYDGMSAVIFATATGVALFDTYSNAFQDWSGGAFPAGPTSLTIDGNSNMLWFTDPGVSCTSAGGWPATIWTDPLAGSVPHGIVADPSPSGPDNYPRAWFVDTVNVAVGWIECGNYWDGGGIKNHGGFTPLSADETPATPYFVAIGADDNVYVTSPSGLLIHQKNGAWLKTVIGDCASPMSVLRAGNHIYVSDHLDGKICRTLAAGADTVAPALYARAPAGWNGGTLLVRGSELWMVLFDATSSLPKAAGLVVPGAGVDAGTVIPYPLTSNAAPLVNTTTLVSIPDSAGANFMFAVTVDPSVPATGSGMRRIEGPNPIGSLSFSPATVAPGQTSVGTVTLASPAGAGGLTVTLVSSSPYDAPVPASVTVPAGQVSATFLVETPLDAFPMGIGIMASSGASYRQTTLNISIP